MNEVLTSCVDRRHRGEHSTACKCMEPVYIRPTHYKPLSREHGRALRNLMTKDKTTGEWSVRRHVSADPLFVFLRSAVGRKRAFRTERRRLLDALFVLLINKVDLVTSIVTVNISRLAQELSPRDTHGKIIHSRAVTTSRISRLIKELTAFGVIQSPETEWDATNGCRLPKHVIITDRGWELTGIDMDKLRAEQDARLRAIEDGFLKPGETISLKAARRRWYEQCRLQTLLSRNTRVMIGRVRTQLSKLSFDERKRQMSEKLYRSLKGKTDELTVHQFRKLVWNKLYTLGLVDLPPPFALPTK